MLSRFQDIWLPRILFYATLAMAAFLIVLVVAAPFLVRLRHDALLDLFADDVAVRRTALGAAIGLVVTAYLCFRPKPKAQEPSAEA